MSSEKIIPDRRWFHPAMMNESRQIFLTGGSGFLGRSLIRRLVDSGYEVKALARSEQAAGTVAACGAVPVLGDLFDTQALTRGMSGCGTVIHSAASMGFYRAWKESHRINVEGTGSLLNTAKKAGVCRFVLVSAAAVLSTGGPMVGLDETTPFPKKAYGPYAATKALAEKQVLAASTNGFAAMAVRPPFIWGAGDTDALPRMIKAIKDKRFFWVNHGDYLYSTCHIKNVCEGLVLAVKNGEGGKAYFVTDGPPATFREFVTGLLSAKGITPPNRSLPLPVAWQLAFLWELAAYLPLVPKPMATRAELALLSMPIQINDQYSRDRLGYQGLMTREEGLLEIKREN